MTMRSERMGLVAVVLSIGSGDAFASDCRPLHGLSTVGHFPDHLILTAGRLTASDLIGVTHIGRPLAPPLIEGSEGCRLNGEVEHLLCVAWSYYRGGAISVDR